VLAFVEGEHGAGAPLPAPGVRGAVEAAEAAVLAGEITADQAAQQMMQALAAGLRATP